MYWHCLSLRSSKDGQKRGNFNSILTSPPSHFSLCLLISFNNDHTNGQTHSQSRAAWQLISCSRSLLTPHHKLSDRHAGKWNDSFRHFNTFLSLCAQTHNWAAFALALLFVWGTHGPALCSQLNCVSRQHPVVSNNRLLLWRGRPSCLNETPDLRMNEQQQQKSVCVCVGGQVESRSIQHLFLTSLHLKALISCFHSRLSSLFFSPSPPQSS